MKAFLTRLEQAADLREVQSLVDHILDAARAGGKPEEKRRFLRDLLFNRALLSRLETPVAIDALLAATTPREWDALFGAAVAQELPQLTVDLVDGLVDLDHRQLLRLLPPQSSKALLQVLRAPQCLSRRMRCLGPLPTRHARRPHHGRHLPNARRRVAGLAASAAALLHRRPRYCPTQRSQAHRQTSRRLRGADQPATEHRPPAQLGRPRQWPRRCAANDRSGLRASLLHPSAPAPGHLQRQCLGQSPAQQGAGRQDAQYRRQPATRPGRARPTAAGSHRTEAVRTPAHPPLSLPGLQGRL